jgi:hypothetical protein
MRWFLKPQMLVGWVPIMALLTSWGIRLPVDPPTQHHVPVKFTATPKKSPESPHVLVWLISDDHHTGLVFPYDWLLDSGFVPPADFGNPPCVAMSWGNTDAYSEQGLGSTLKLCEVIFTPTHSVMELIAINWSVAEVCPHQRIWRKLVARENGPQLAHFLNECSAKGPDSRPKVVRPASWGKGLQLQGRHSYFIPRVCNVWTVQAIECLGGEINPWLALTADGLIRQAEKAPNDFEKIWPGQPKNPETKN